MFALLSLCFPFPPSRPSSDKVQAYSAGLSPERASPNNRGRGRLEDDEPTERPMWKETPPKRTKIDVPSALKQGRISVSCALPHPTPRWTRSKKKRVCMKNAIFSC